MRLEGKSALITGAGSGIGRETSLLFAREGAGVAAVDIDRDSGAETASQIESAGGHCLFVAADVSKAADCEAMVRVAEAELGHLDVLFNNAGISHIDDGDAEQTEEATGLTLVPTSNGVSAFGRF